MNPSTFNPITFKKLTSAFQKFDNWLFSVRCLLTSCDLWEVCTREANTEDPNEKSKTEKAIAIIGQACDESVYPIIMSLKTAYEVMNRLKSYARGGIKKKLSLTRKLLSVQYNDNMQEYIKEFLDTKEELQGLGIPVNDKLLAMFMLEGLPDEFDALVMRLDDPDLQITSEIVVEALLKEDTRAVPVTSGWQQTTARSRGPACRRCRKRFKSTRGLKHHITRSKGHCLTHACESAGSALPPKRAKPTEQAVPGPSPAPASTAMMTSQAAAASTAMMTSQAVPDSTGMSSPRVAPASNMTPRAAPASNMTPQAAPVLQQAHQFVNQLNEAQQQILQRLNYKYRQGVKLSDTQQRILKRVYDHRRKGVNWSTLTRR